MLPYQQVRYCYQSVTQAESQGKSSGLWVEQSYTPTVYNNVFIST